MNKVLVKDLKVGQRFAFVEWGGMFTVLYNRPTDYGYNAITIKLTNMSDAEAVYYVVSDEFVLTE